jgi:hypothetical protein
MNHFFGQSLYLFEGILVLVYRSQLLSSSCVSFLATMPRFESLSAAQMMTAKAKESERSHRENVPRSQPAHHSTQRKDRESSRTTRESSHSSSRERVVAPKISKRGQTDQRERASAPPGTTRGRTKTPDEGARRQNPHSSRDPPRTTSRTQTPTGRRTSCAGPEDPHTKRAPPPLSPGTLRNVVNAQAGLVAAQANFLALLREQGGTTRNPSPEPDAPNGGAHSRQHAVDAFVHPGSERTRRRNAQRQATITRQRADAKLAKIRPAESTAPAMRPLVVV